MGAEGLLMAAGGVTLAGSIAKEKRIPGSAINILAATITLVILASTIRNTPLNRPITALAGLMLLVAVYVNVPAFTKGKKNG